MGFSHDEDSEYPTFFCSAAEQVGNNKSMLSLINGSSSHIVRIREVRIISSQISSVSGVVAEFQFRRCAGHSSGFLLQPLTHDTQDTLDSSITARTGATISGEVATPLRRYLWSSDEWNPGAEDVESMDHTIQQLVPCYVPGRNTKPITLNPGEGLTIKQVTNTSAGNFDIQVVFTQE